MPLHFLSTGPSRLTNLLLVALLCVLFLTYTSHERLRYRQLVAARPPPTAEQLAASQGFGTGSGPGLEASPLLEEEFRKLNVGKQGGFKNKDYVKLTPEEEDAKRKQEEERRKKEEEEEKTRKEEEEKKRKEEEQGKNEEERKKAEQDKEKEGKNNDEQDAAGTKEDEKADDSKVEAAKDSTDKDKESDEASSGPAPISKQGAKPLYIPKWRRPPTWIIPDPTWDGWEYIENLFVFGDSYSDTGFRLSGVLPSQQNPIGNHDADAEKVFTPKWPDFLARTYNQTSTMLWNLAWGGSTIDRAVVAAWSLSSSLTEEVKSFLDETKNQKLPQWKASTSLFAILIGLHDLILYSEDPKTNGAAAPVDDAIIAYRKNLETVSVLSFVVFGAEVDTRVAVRSRSPKLSTHQSPSTTSRTPRRFCHSAGRCSSLQRSASGDARRICHRAPRCHYIPFRPLSSDGRCRERQDAATLDQGN